MEVVSKAKFIRLSTKKARPVADVVRGQNALHAAESLKHMHVRAAKEIRKVLNTAIANAENNFNLDKKALTISQIMIDGGPALKRIRFRGKGGVGAIKKPTSHITVIVSGEVKTKKVAESKAEGMIKASEVKTEDQDHKIEMDRGNAFKKESVAPNAAKPATKMFRRKTG